MDALHAAGIRFAGVLQAGPPWLENFWISVTSLADPKSIFTICFPLAYFLDREVGLSVLWIGLVTEWLNVVLKWFLFGERPFWWIHESGFVGKELLRLRQFPASCETGPGSPSGHCMITAAALWPLVVTLTELASKHSKSLVLKLLPFGAYILLQLAVGLSRIFILAHFPHQVVAGTLAGAALGWGLQPLGPTCRSPLFFAATALALPLGSLALHGLALAAGLDLDWSIRLAAARCRDPAWLRPDTRPFASVCRDAGTAAGLALAAAFPPPRARRPGTLARLAGASLALLATRGLHGLPQPAGTLPWYCTCFLAYAAGPWLVASLLPRLLLALGPTPGSHHDE